MNFVNHITVKIYYHKIKNEILYNTPYLVIVGLLLAYNLLAGIQKSWHSRHFLINRFDQNTVRSSFDQAKTDIVLFLKINNLSHEELVYYIRNREISIDEFDTKFGM